MIYVYTKDPVSAEPLAGALKGEVLKKFDGMLFYRNGRKPVEFEKNDMVLCWGTSLPEMEQVRVLNPSTAKTHDLVGKRLYEVISSKGIIVVENFAYKGDPNKARNKGGGSKYYYPRSLKSKGGNDLLFGLPSGEEPDFWTTKCPVYDEYYLHVFNGKVIKTGKKTPINGLPAANSDSEWVTAFKDGQKMYHPWVRSELGGWGLDYEAKVSTTVRAIAKKATTLAGVKMGAIKIGDSGGYQYVIGIDRCPVLSNVVLNLYVKNIMKMAEGDKEDPEVKETEEEVRVLAAEAARQHAAEVARQEEELAEIMRLAQRGAHNRRIVAPPAAQGAQEVRLQDAFENAWRDFGQPVMPYPGAVVGGIDGWIANAVGDGQNLGVAQDPNWAGGQWIQLNDVLPVDNPRRLGVVNG